MKHWKFKSFLFVLFIALTVHIGALNNPFIQDDYHSIVDNPSIKTLSRLPRYFIDGREFSGRPDWAMYRPLLVTTFALNSAISTQPTGFRLVNIFLLAMNTWLMIRLFLILGSSKQLAMIAGILFLINPIQTQPVNLISARSVLLGTTFGLSSLLFYLRGRTFISLICYGLALLSSEAPSVFIVLCFMASMVMGGKLIKSVLKLIPHTLLLALYMVLRNYVLGSAVGEGHIRSVWENFSTQMKVFWIFMKLYLWPTGLNFYHDIPVETLMPSIAAICCIIGSGAIFLIGAWLFLSRKSEKSARLCGFFLLWPFIVLLPYILIPLNIILNEHHLHVAIAAPSYFLALLIYKGARKFEVSGEGLTKAGIILFLVICGLWGALAVQRDNTFRSQVSFLRDSIKKSPLYARPYLDLGSALYGGSDWGADFLDAEQYLKKSLELDPGLVEAHLNLGIVHYYQQRIEESVYELNTYISLMGKKEKSGYPYFILGIIAKEQNRPKIAESLFQKSVTINPSKDNPAWTQIRK